MNAKLENRGVFFFKNFVRVSAVSYDFPQNKALLLAPSASPLPPESVGSEARPRETLKSFFCPQKCKP